MESRGSNDRISRRTLLQTAAGVATTPYLFAIPTWAAASTVELPLLPYPFDALAPSISKETLQYHYGKHHATYVKNLNTLLEQTPMVGASLEQIIQQSSGPIFNNAAQVWNHTFYWNCLTPKGGGQPSGPLAEAIAASFGSFADFKSKFTQAATTLFGSGWVWLVRTRDGRLAIETTGNAGCPITEGKTPLLACDVWEHAYYIDYRNARARYVEAFWKLVNWEFASRQ
jgi:Fe-Mn family superoxide dismutase